MVWTHSGKKTRNGSNNTLEIFHSLLQPTLLLPSMSQKKSGINWKTSRQKHQDLLLPRLLPVPSNSTINIVEYMLEIGTLTKILLLSLIPLFRSIMESRLMQSIHLTWTQLKSRAILWQMHLCTLLGSGLVGLLMDLVSHLVLQKNSVLELKVSWRVPSRTLLGIWLASIIPSPAWMKRYANNWWMTISFLCLGIKISKLLAWREIGLKEEEFSTMIKKPSWFGWMRKISWELSPWKMEGTWKVSLIDWQEESRLLGIQWKRNQEKTSALMQSMATFTLAQPTLVLAWELLFTWTFQDGPGTVLTSWKPDVKSYIFSPGEPEENLVVRLAILMTYLTNIDWDIQRSS